MTTKVRFLIPADFQIERVEEIRNGDGEIIELVIVPLAPRTNKATSPIGRVVVTTIADDGTKTHSAPIELVTNQEREILVRRPGGNPARSRGEGQEVVDAGQ